MEWMRETNEMRLAYSDALIERGRVDERICVVEADLMGSSSTGRFQKLFPERTIDVGVAEANMIGVAAGLAAMGKIPFTHTFTPFASRRCCDQVTLSVAYARMNVKMVGSDPGICAELNGGTHMSFEDMAIMRNIPGMVVCEPVDSVQLRKLFGQIVDHEGPVYMRLFRKAAWKVFDESAEFTLGKAYTLKKGRDATVFATGIMVKEALDAAETLAGEGVDVEVVNIHTLKPLDTQAVLESVTRTGCCVTAENAFAINGLGSAVADCVCAARPCPVLRVGVDDRFGEVGKLDYLQSALHLTAADIVEKVRAAIAMK